MSTRVILNPKAGSGRAAARLVEIRRALSAAKLEHELRETEGPGHATELAREAREQQIETIAIVGGDGTLNEVSQAYLSEAGASEPGPRIALIPAGTGGDFRKTFGFSESLAESIERLKRPKPRAIDLGVLECVGHDENTTRKSFLNIMSFGIGGLTDQLVNEGPKWLGGRAAFFLGTLKALARYENAPLRITVDDEPWIEGPILNIAVANGRFFGGGMHIAPNALPDDGLFDVVALGDISATRSLLMTPQIYRGTHRSHEQVFFLQGKKVVATQLDSRREVLIDNDGETPGKLPLKAEIHPGALELLV